jgi:hypothetical protein
MFQGYTLPPKAAKGRAPKLGAMEEKFMLRMGTKVITRETSTREQL